MSELLTNAVRAGCRTARLTLVVHHDVLRIAVDDDAPGLPRHLAPGEIRDDNDGTPGGWGLRILDHLVSDWAVERLIPGKTVWIELPIPTTLTLDMAGCHRPLRFGRTAIDPAQLADNHEPVAVDDVDA